MSRYILYFFVLLSCAQARSHHSSSEEEEFSEPIPIQSDSTVLQSKLGERRGVRPVAAPPVQHRHRSSASSEESNPPRQQFSREYVERMKAYREKQRREREYKEMLKAREDQMYEDYFNRMKAYAIQTHVNRYNTMLQTQANERSRFVKSMREFGIKDYELPEERAAADTARPSSPFGDVRDASEIRGKPRVGAVPVLPSNIEPRPENRDVHRKAIALQALCARFQPTVRKHCSGNKTEKEFVKKCNGYFHDCRGFLPQSDPLYNIAYAVNSNVGLNLGSWSVDGIPYYPINEEGGIGAGLVSNVPFGSWGGGYSQNLGVRDYWSQTLEVGANWYEGKYGYKSGWSVPLVQSLGIEGDTHALVSVPLKPGEAGKPVGVDVGGGVGPYYQQNQHVGVDYMNGNVNTNFGVGVPMAGVGVNTGLGIQFPSVNDFNG